LASETLSSGSEPLDDDAFVDLVPMLRRVIGSRVKDPATIEDLVQETLARVLSAQDRVDPERLSHYASVTARNLVASLAERNDRIRDRAHLLADQHDSGSTVDDVLVQEERSIVTAALAHLPQGDRDLLLAHEVEGEDTKTMAAGRNSTPGAVAARLSRARASLRVEYLLAAEGVEPPTDRCRPVLRALSSGDRRRQRELDAHGHLLECSACAHIRTELARRREEQPEEGVIRVHVERDADVVVARQRGRDAAAEAGFSTADQTVVATAISEIARNIVKFAERGEVTISALSAEGRRGIKVVARDVGPGIADPGQALEDGYSTYHGLGLGLPGAKRLMDVFDLDSTPGEGTTVTMEKWLA
jgi:RNA polymerase sigma factor (sigma-70 family)